LAVALKENTLCKQVADEIAREAGLLDDRLGYRARWARRYDRRSGVWRYGRLRDRRSGV
jgi:hypothetical protein